MLLKNDKIVLKKDFGGLKKGTIFQVSEIFEDGTISFKNDSVGVGVVSFGEYEKMFEKCVKREFTEWTSGRLGYGFRHNGKVVEVRLSLPVGKPPTGRAVCHEDDEFDLDKGIKIAENRALIKHFKRRITNCEETLKNLTKDDEIVIGQRVKVRKDLVDGVGYGSNCYVKAMGCLGEYITISEIVRFSDYIEYRAKETSRFLWTKQMFDM